MAAIMTDGQADRLASKHTWTEAEAIRFAVWAKAKHERDYVVRSVSHNMGTFQVFNVEEEEKPWHGKVVFSTVTVPLPITKGE